MAAEPSPPPRRSLVARLFRFRGNFRPPRRLKFTREGKFFVGITLGVGFAAINTGNNLLYLLLGMLLALIIVRVPDMSSFPHATVFAGEKLLPAAR